MLRTCICDLRRAAGPPRRNEHVRGPLCATAVAPPRNGLPLIGDACGEATTPDRRPLSPFGVPSNSKCSAFCGLPPPPATMALPSCSSILLWETRVATDLRGTLNGVRESCASVAANHHVGHISRNVDISLIQHLGSLAVRGIDNQHVIRLSHPNEAERSTRGHPHI